MMGFWDRLSPAKRPDPALEEKLRVATEELEAVNQRESKITQISDWLDRRLEADHFGDDLSITYVRKRHA